MFTNSRMKISGLFLFLMVVYYVTYTRLTSEMSYGLTGVEGTDLTDGICHRRGWLKNPMK